MSFNLGQFRKDNQATANYTTDVPFSLEDVETVTDFSDSIKFKDKAIILTSTNKLGSDKSYYLQFRLHKNTTTQQVALFLRNSEAVEDETQNITSYSVSASADTSEYVEFELIFTPNGTYDQIVFELQHQANDYMDEKSDGYYGRTLNIDITYLRIIKNVLDFIDGVSELVKIGVQGPPGLLMCINGEEIRIGRSGIYEITNGYITTFIGFIIKSSEHGRNGEDYFILDYQYE